MKILKNWSAAILFLLVLMMSMGYPNRTREGKTPLTPGEKKVIRNRYGAVIQDSRGQRFNYTREQLRELQEQSLQVPQSLTSSISDNSKATDPSESFWSYAAFGNCIGISGIITAKRGEILEMYLGGSTVTFGTNDYWYALHYNAATGQYEQTYVSTYFPFRNGITSINVADVIGNPGNEILVVLEDGHIHIYDQATKKWLKEVVTAAKEVTDMEIADVDNDGEKEIILCSDDHLYVYSPSGTLEWEINAGGYDAIVGQMDDDSALEIAVTGGQVIDCASRTIQWNLTKKFGYRLKAADIDSDHKEELIVSEGWYTIWAYDADRQLPKWSIPIELDIAAIYLEDIDKDSVIELLVGEGQWGNIMAYDTVTLAKEWSIANPDCGVTNIAIGDIDGDGFSEVIWGAGASSTGEDHLYITNWKTGHIEWQNTHLDAPFIGPVFGDLDGDGKNEMVSATFSSDSGYNCGRILVFDSNHHLRSISNETNSWDKISNIELFDVDRDGNQDILVSNGVFINIYDFNLDNTFTLKWTNIRPESSDFYSFDSLAAGDIDGDSQLEILGGSTGSQGGHIYVYNYNSGREEWHSLQMGGYFDEISEVIVSDLDKDGTQEIIGMVYNDYVYIFNGVTKELEAIIQGNYTAVSLLKPDRTIPALALGDEDGDISIYTYSNEKPQMIFNRNYGTGAIDGISSKSTTENRSSAKRGPSTLPLPMASYGPVPAMEKCLEKILPTGTIYRLFIQRVRIPLMGLLSVSLAIRK